MHPSDIKIGQLELSVGEIVNMIDNEQILLEPYSNSSDRFGMSMSIESILLGLTMTPFYVDASNPDKWLVLDGTKRLKAIEKFVSGKLKLLNLELLSEYNAMYFNDLPKNIARRLIQSRFTIYSINQGVPPDVRLSLIRRIVPDIKNGLSSRMRISLLTPISSELIDHLSEFPNFLEILRNTKVTSELELEIKYLKSLYSHFRNNKFDRFFSGAKTEDIIIITNYYAETEFNFILNTWNKGLKRITDLYQNFAFKTSIKSRYINKYYFDFLIIYFGAIISDELWNNLNRKRDSFLQEWFSFLQSDEEKNVFKSSVINRKIESFDSFIKQFIVK